MQGFGDRSNGPRGPLWLPPGVRIGRWSGGSAMPLRPPTLLRAVHASWGAANDAFVPAVAIASEIHPARTPCSAAYRLSEARAEKRARTGDPARARALEFFAGFIKLHADHSSLAQRMQNEGEEFTAGAPSLGAALEAKKTATLVKRAGALKLYNAWFVSLKTADHVFAEKAVFQYMQYLVAERAAATRAMSLSQAINFAGGILGFHVKEVATSSRVRGLVVRMLKTRPVLRQRDPLTVAMVRCLEGLTIHSTDPFTKVFAGSVLFCLYGRARVGDLARSATEPFLDIPRDLSGGFVQGALLDHKTARPGSKRALPVAAPVLGVSGKNWASSWVQARSSQRLDASMTGTLLPAPAVDGSWTCVPMTTLEFGAALREMLSEGGFARDELGNVGAHSLKSTALSWLAKAGIDRDTRRVLGYHIKADERSMEAYSRDSMAGPLRQLARVIADIAAGRLLPDVTRSGQFVTPPTPDGGSSTNTSRAASPASPELSSDSERSSLAEASEEDAEETMEAEKFVKNARTSTFHVLLDSKKMACGRYVPLHFSCHEELPDDARLCARCF